MGEKRCLVCGFEDTSSICCPNCGTLMLPKKRNFRVRGLTSFEVPSESMICWGRWMVRKYKINGVTIWVCDCPSYIKNGYCKHIQHIEQQEQQNIEQQEQQNQQQEEADAEAILEAILNT